MKKKGLVPSPKWKKKNIKNDPRWYDGETAVLAIGQGYLQVTPLQLLYAVNSVVNGGKLFRPMLVSKIHASFILDEQIHELEYVSTDIARNHLDLVKQGMFQVVQGTHGTGRRARIGGHKIGGKTGTVQVMNKKNSQRDHGWFFGFSPVEEPEYSVIIFLENEGGGGHKPALMARRIFKKIWEKHQYEQIFAQKN